MKVYKNSHISKKFKNNVIAIGNFDGLHLGHQKVIKTGKYIAKKNNLKFGFFEYTGYTSWIKLGDEEKLETSSTNHKNFLTQLLLYSIQNNSLVWNYS